MKRLPLLLLTLVLPILHCRAVEISKLTADTQRLDQESQQLTMVWWIPTEFWQATLEKTPNVTEAQRNEFVRVLDNYTIFAVASLEVGPFGGLTAKPRQTVLENITFSINGTEQTVLGSSEISPDALNFVQMMKPMMGQMLGQFGQGLEFILYANPPPKGKKLSAKKEGGFRLFLFGKNFDWKLPLPSLLPPKIDPKTKQEFPGDFRFNPYTGEELQSK